VADQIGQLIAVATARLTVNLAVDVEGTVAGADELIE
jgi:hypothetical protein